MKRATPRKVPLRRKRIARAAADAERGIPDTERRGIPNDVPARRKPRRV
jgi:hypothetical protein